MSTPTRSAASETIMIPPLFEEDGEALPEARLPKRDTALALKRGVRNRCPACGEGKILGGYLTVNETCPACHEELHHHRADDFPQYVTIFVVGHVLVAALLMVDDLWPNIPVGYHFAVWPLLVVILCLWLLPIFKAMLIAYQWALRMHGFETAHRVPSLDEGADREHDHAKVRTAA